MARFNVPNINDPDYGNTFQAFRDAIQRIADQANVDPSSSQVSSPPQVGGISVIEANGIHDIQIQDNSPAYRGLQYSAYYSRTPDMRNAHRIDLGESQNHRVNLGSGQYYWAASSKYTASDDSPMTFHGGSSPIPVGSGDHIGPPMQAAQGFQGQFRNSPIPPVRG